MSRDVILAARREGAVARRLGDSLDANPYVPATLQAAWRLGYANVAARTRIVRP